MIDLIFNWMYDELGVGGRLADYLMGWRNGSARQEEPQTIFV